MKVSFHEDPIDVEAVCTALSVCDAVYWHTTRPNFKSVLETVRRRGVDALGLCASTLEDPFMNFLAAPNAADGDMARLVEGVSLAIAAWQSAGEPLPHVEIVTL